MFRAASSRIQTLPYTFIRYISSICKNLLFHFVKPPNDTLLCYLKVFYLMPTPSSLQYNNNRINFDLVFENILFKTQSNLKIMQFVLF